MNKMNFSMLQMNTGANRIRLISKPYMGFFHYIDGFSKKCAMYDGECKLCEDSEISKHQRRWIVAVIDRKLTGIYENFLDKCKLLSMGGAIFGEIQKLSRMKEWGDPAGYDLNIEINAYKRPIFTVHPIRRIPLECAAKKEAEKSVEIMKATMENMCDPTVDIDSTFRWHPLSYKIACALGPQPNLT